MAVAVIESNRLADLVTNHGRPQVLWCLLGINRGGRYVYTIKKLILLLRVYMYSDGGRAGSVGDRPTNPTPAGQLIAQRSGLFRPTLRTSAVRKSLRGVAYP